VPYVNSLSASDLADGSKTVKIQGEPTALEDQSNISTSTGNEAGTQGGSVITHKTKGKGYFTTWSHDVKVEGKGVCRHSDMMGQNCTSSPPACVDASAITTFLATPGLDKLTPCPPNSNPRTKCTPKQYEKVRGKPCWECGTLISGYTDSAQMTPDHQPPVKAAWEMGGCHMKPSPDKFIETFVNNPDVVRPHCQKHMSIQGGTMRCSVTEIRSWMT
jgi:uncharacterized Zn-binding protein involved in type VI secretion